MSEREGERERQTERGESVNVHIERDINTCLDYKTKSPLPAQRSTITGLNETP